MWMCQRTSGKQGGNNNEDKLDYEGEYYCQRAAHSGIFATLFIGAGVFLCVYFETSIVMIVMGTIFSVCGLVLLAASIGLGRQARDLRTNRELTPEIPLDDGESVVVTVITPSKIDESGTTP